MPEVKPGDHVAVAHDCTTDFGTVRHDSPVLVTSVRPDAVIPHVRGVRCDGTQIEWSFAEEESDD
ncbi:hypothetical protein QWY28_17220 [Nocardioides sp. SOB77]|uniref:Uncharacterized protein n=1 Tax=Nocardioides oceani TaxID=3058369 RepID=A0ABT8FJ59_9ACTN|nr:hypothetical protein [Nocardioides oceani]MDN4174703.1 hypothetical protein [Nocardioides oceani]MDN4174705.1 hypothetical protein [Nocardioides oceani]